MLGPFILRYTFNSKIFVVSGLNDQSFDKNCVLKFQNIIALQYFSLCSHLMVIYMSTAALDARTHNFCFLSTFLLKITF